MFDRAHVLVQAPGGGGKTFWSATGGKPLYLAAEVKCRKVVARLNPNARIIPLESIEDFNKAIEMVQSPKLQDHGFTRVVTDSFTEITEYLPTWLNLGFPLQKQHYGQIQNKAMELMLAILHSPIPSITICRSVAKEFGDITKVVPGSLGKSAENLPAKCVITAETRHDDEKGWLVDTTPSPYTQRSGLPWVPQIFQGTADEFLALVEATDETPTASAAATATHGTATPAAPAESAPATRPARAAAAPKAQAEPPKDSAINPTAALAGWSNAIVEFNQLTFKLGWSTEDRTKAYKAWEARGFEGLKDLQAENNRLQAQLTPRAAGPDPEKDPEGYRKAAGEMFQEMAEEKRTQPQEIPAAAAAFADAVAEGPGRATPEDIAELLDLCREHKIDCTAMWGYAAEKGGAVTSKDGSLNWNSLSKAFVALVVPKLKDSQKRPAIIPWLNQKYCKIPF